MSRRARAFAEAAAAKRIALLPDAAFDPDACPECDGAGFVEWDHFTHEVWPCKACMPTAIIQDSKGRAE